MSDSRGEVSQRFWRQAQSGRLDKPEIYSQQHFVLNTYILPLLPQGGRLLDLGCADGEITQVLAKDCLEVLGVDLSPYLIEQAGKRQVQGLRFMQGDITTLEIEGRYERMASMGLLACLIEPAVFERAVQAMVQALQPGGYLVLEDWLMVDGAAEHYHCDAEYETIYRQEAQYLQAFTRHGLRLVQRFVLAEGQQSQARVLYLLHRPASAEATAPVAAGKKLSVAIFYQLPASWSNVSSVWTALCKDESIHTTVVLLPFLHVDYGWNRQDSQRHLDALGVPYVYWDELDPDTAHFDVALFTSPYDATRPLPYQFAEVSRRVAFTAYIPYGLEVGGGEANMAMQFGQPLEMHAAAVYVRSEGAKALFGRHCPTGDRHVVVSGHPRMDGLVNLENFPVDLHLLEQIGERRAVLWNAHFSFDADQWSTFDRLGLDIVAAFAARKDLALLFRPHPLLWRKLINMGLLDASGVAAMRSELEALGVIIDERADHRHAFAASDAMMSDVGSFLMEYLVTGKPVLYLENPHGLGLNTEGEAVVQHYDHAADMAGAEAFLDGLSQRSADDASRRKALIEHFFAGFDGHSGERVVNHIKTAFSL